MLLGLGDRPPGMGCMRLSTAPDRDATRAVATLHAALDAGVRFLDTADAYCRDDTEIGHNERLIAGALATWAGERSAVRIATKGGLTRPGGRWVPDGRARHLVAACEASRLALGIERIGLYQLHAPDPRVPLATSVRALAALQREGRIEAIGLCNVTLGQLREARRLAEIASVQVELSLWHDASVHGGVAEYCIAHGIPLIAYRPLGGPQGRRRIQADGVLAEIAARHAATPFEVALAWLWDLSPLLLPIPGPTSVAHARSLARVREIRLGDAERAQLDARFPAGRLLRLPGARRAPPDAARGEVVLVMGMPGAGKSSFAAELVREGYERLNRDAAGGRLAALLPALERVVASGKTRVVLDNTYASRASRGAVIERAWALGLPVRCVWVKTEIEDAQFNAAGRMVARHGRLLAPEELKRAARTDPGAFAPGVQYRYARELEPPEASEGFSRVEVLRFERRREPRFRNRAVLFWYDGVLRRSRSGQRTPSGPEDVELLPGRRELLRRYRDEGWLLLGLSWHPELSAGAVTPEVLAACFARTHELLAAEIEVLYCPHPGGPPICWCRKPMPGLGVVFTQRHQLDAPRCLYVAEGPSDRAFAARIGFQFREARGFFGSDSDLS
jgi:aryl-alcohol dehydrogenase-like predicted oxidoreductase/predicted kinase/histidinol phosphatase-like enzyme